MRNAGFQRGVAYGHSYRGPGGYGTAISAKTIAELRDRNVDSISVIPFAYMQSPTDTVVRTVYERRGQENDRAMEADIRAAHDLGIRVMLKPHIWISRGSWPGEIAFESEKDWSAWFASYRAMVLHYAELARELNVASLCIGCELKATSAVQPEKWRGLIAAVREVYAGELIYAANWDEYDKIVWWDELDAIGINAYFPLSSETDPTLEQLKAGAATARDRIAAFQRGFDKPVVFTELGFRSMVMAGERPWDHEDWLEPDPELQARCYRAIFETYWDAPWLRGMYWWKWVSNASVRPDRTDRDPFSPRNKPAEQVLTDWYDRPHASEDGTRKSIR